MFIADSHRPVARFHCACLIETYGKYNLGQTRGNGEAKTRNCFFARVISKLYCYEL